MKILIALTYFHPYKSGLSMYAQRLAQALVKLGHEVIVLTSRYDSSLPGEDVDEGVKIIRLPVAIHISKGVIMPSVLSVGRKWIGWADVVNLHLPQMDAGTLSLISWCLKKPVIVTYHCDLDMPSGIINWLAEKAIRFMHKISVRKAAAIVHNTQDYAENSKFLSKYLKKLTIIPSPIDQIQALPEDINTFRKTHGIGNNIYIIGLAARLAAEKGVEYLVEALPRVIERFPDVKVLCMGEYQKVIGEESYYKKIMPSINALQDHWSFLGVLSESDKAAFFSTCDVLVLPSINRTESFGMVQIEAMQCGTPVIATDLPGVRQPVLQTGMGVIVQPKDTRGLANAIIDLIDKKDHHQINENLKKQYSSEIVAKAYEDLFLTCLH
ncbi:MAG: glycosyltransferase family 4 protein [Anaerolineaceae bacterium]|nr:glycosyltransferase family 4 protein [Anaerolineaceae bacterium]